VALTRHRETLEDFFVRRLDETRVPDRGDGALQKVG